MLAASPCRVEQITPSGHHGTWVWHVVDEATGTVGGNVAIRYTCSLYWALTVMTTLKVRAQPSRALNRRPTALARGELVRFVPAEMWVATVCCS